MKVCFLSLLAMALAGCAADATGKRESAWEAVKRWDDSMNTTIDRLQNKSYND